jgi:hypothetical protein
MARWLVQGKGLSWVEATKYLKNLEGTDAESSRIVLVNYFAAVLLNTKSETAVMRLLELLEAFKVPYNASDRLAPLIFSVGLALNLDRK